MDLLNFYDILYSVAVLNIFVVLLCHFVVGLFLFWCHFVCFVAIILFLMVGLNQFVVGLFFSVTIFNVFLAFCATFSISLWSFSFSLQSVCVFFFYG